VKMTYKFLVEQRKRRFGEARAALKRTLSGESNANIELISPEELEAARLKLIKENSFGEGYALRKAKKQLEETLSKKQIEEERL
jgi:hypothetical protein